MLGRVEQLKVRVKELEQQLQEAAREVSWLGGCRPLIGARVHCLNGDLGVCLQAEMERALLQGEREAERTLLQKEQKAVDQLQEKLVALETGIQKERDKVIHTWPSSVLGTSGPGEKEKCLPWGPEPLT